MSRLDPHSVAQEQEPHTRHLVWKARVDFAGTRLHAQAALHLAAPTAAATQFSLDTRGLTITNAVDQAGAQLPFTLHEPEGVLGAPLVLRLPPGTSVVQLTYSTARDASALQWLSPVQTHGGVHPYLFSQCQAIHARSVVPLQDTPSRRLTYTAELTVPRGLTAVMAASSRASADGPDGTTTFRFEMPQPIAPYLLAFAVGELASRELSPRSRVWCEPGLVDAAAWEFSGVEQQLAAAEALYGPYDWERFDLLVMPPAFPYGGMENPRLTFLTPTLVTGDRSLIDVVAHELAHSWTGNLVTNANAEHFWLNEGFTVYAERRILEALEGRAVSELHAAQGRAELDAAVARFAAAGTPELSRLRTHLLGVDPDEAFSQVPYEKGYLLLRALEEAAGRGPFDAALKAWLRRHRFEAVTTDDFLAHFGEALPGALERVRALEWIDGAGVPPDAPRAQSGLLAAVQARLGSVPDSASTAGWSAVQWQIFLDAAPRPVAPTFAEALEERLGQVAAKNPEVKVAWLKLALEAGLTRVLPEVEAFLGSVGRMKYLKPLYGALLARPATQGAARACFARNQGRYHPIAQQVLASVIARVPA